MPFCSQAIQLPRRFLPRKTIGAAGLHEGGSSSFMIIILLKRYAPQLTSTPSSVGGGSIGHNTRIFASRYPSACADVQHRVVARSCLQATAIRYGLARVAVAAPLISLPRRCHLQVSSARESGVIGPASLVTLEIATRIGCGFFVFVSAIGVPLAESDAHPGLQLTPSLARPAGLSGCANSEKNRMDVTRQIVGNAPASRITTRGSEVAAGRPADEEELFPQIGLY